MQNNKRGIIPVYEELRYTDGFIFGKVNKNTDVVVETLETILGKEIDKSDIYGGTDSEKFVKQTSDSKGIRLDIHLMTEHQIYNAEMENYSSEKKKEIRKRTRYYQGLIDMDHLYAGMKYYDLKETYIIFICTYDVFGKGYFRYQFENRCIHDHDLTLDDGTVKIFLNSKGYRNAPDDEVSQEIKNYLKYVETGEAVDELTRRIDMEVINVQNNKIFKREYMKQMADIMDYEHTIEIKDAEIEDYKAEVAVQAREIARLKQLLAESDNSVEE